MVLVIAALLALAALIAYGLNGWQRMARMQPAGIGAPSAGAPAAATRPAAVPDPPRSFGATATWLAVRATDCRAVARALGLRTVLPANWESGLTAAVGEGVFVTPPIDGWVLAVGRDVARATAQFPALAAVLGRLAEEFGEAQWFTADSDTDCFGWARAERRVLQRAYRFAAESGHVSWHGEVTAAERHLGCFVDDPRDQSDDPVKWWPDQRLVAALAAAWSLDPTALSRRRLPASVGCLGRL